MSTVHCKSHEGGCQLHLQALAATLGQHVQSSQAAVLWESLGQGLRVHREVLQQIALFQLGDASLCRHQLPAQQAPQMQLLPICAFALQPQSLKNPETLSMAVSCMHSMRATLVKALAQSCCSPLFLLGLVPGQPGVLCGRTGHHGGACRARRRRRRRPPFLLLPVLLLCL